MGSGMIEMWGSVTAAAAVIIALCALIKTARAESREKRFHSIRLYEQYIGSIGKWLTETSLENKKEYRSYYYQIRLYLEPAIREQMDQLDTQIENGETDKLHDEILRLNEKFTEIYSLSGFGPRKKGNRSNPFIEIRINK